MGEGFRYHSKQGGEADAVARASATGCCGAPSIPRRSWLPRRTASVEDGCVVLREEKSPHRVKMKRKVKIRRKEMEGGGEVVGASRKRRKTAVGEANSGDEILRPGGTVWSRTRGNMERNGRASYSRRRQDQRGSKSPVIKTRSNRPRRVHHARDLGMMR